MSVRPNSESKDYSLKGGFTLLELIAKGDEKDRILKVKFSLPKIITYD